MYPYTGPKLIELLERQHQDRSQNDLFKKGTFTLRWRTKVGSFPHPDLETIVSAGEPCGAWSPRQGRPEHKRNVADNWQNFRKLPLYGYIPGSSIRGIVRAWAMQRPQIADRMRELLGYQETDSIHTGKVEFLDAFPTNPTKLTLDIVNPQQSFQVYHQGQSTPLSFYTLGDGKRSIEFTVAIRGIPGQATADEVQEVWQWVQQALSSQGLGSRTASGYGSVKAPKEFKSNAELRLPEGYSSKQFEFTLYSQGSAGPNIQTPELRPSHWRGWLRSWMLRFLLGVMSQENAERTVAELLGTLEPNSCRGTVRLQMSKGKIWENQSLGRPSFYAWEGQISLNAPSGILNQIILPIIRFAVTVGGVGRGWRRPLHVFRLDNGYTAARGTHLTLTHKVRRQGSDKIESIKYGLRLKASEWETTYQQWQKAVQTKWPERILVEDNNLVAEVFSPGTCAVYAVPGPAEEPIDYDEVDWNTRNAVDTRGGGMELIYRTRQSNPPRNYKRNPEMGGNAGAGEAYCSWASIRRVNIPNPAEETDCQEIVCLFMGGQTPNTNHIRSQFLRDLANVGGSIHLFGVHP